MMIHFNILINFVNKDICYHIQDIIANKLLRYKRQIHIYHLSNILNLMKKNDLSFKVLILLLTLYLPPIYLSGQIDWSTNRPRSGDKVIKKQINYIEPGESGENVTWDLSRLEDTDTKFIQNYTTPKLIADSIYIMGTDTFLKEDVLPEELVIGIENYTVYYYRVRNEGITLLGFENPVTEIHYQNPLLQINYPFNLNDCDSMTFETTGLYSKELPLKSLGDIRIESDAKGQIILPSGDTLYNVLRMKTIQNIRDTSSMNMTQTSYNWFAEGYRYPVLETLHTENNTSDGTQEVFRTSFFYPPEQHQYLEDDINNQQVLNRSSEKGTVPPSSIAPGFADYSIKGDGWGCNVYPTPIETNLNLEYKTEKEAKVKISLYDMGGKLLYLSPTRHQQSGYYTDLIDCRSLTTGNYVLRIMVGEEEMSRIITKK